jgi:RimJ/RimL family protein N-acetyltransferase
MKSNTIIRAALPKDALPWATMLLQLDKEVEYTMFEAGERSPDISKYKDKIIASNNHPKSAIFFAIDNLLIGNNIVGYLSIDAFRNNRKRHIATVGIGILESHRSKGIATKLFLEMIKHAQNNGLKRIEAHIANSNSKSISLVKKFGFVTEGIKRKAIRINNAYLDEYLMALEVVNHDE